MHGKSDRRLILAVLCLVVVACTMGTDRSLTQSVTDTVVGTGKDAFSALQTPLEDLNLKRDPIPKMLEICATNPYAMPLPPQCATIPTELTELNRLLGPDMEPEPLPWLPKPKKIAIRPYVSQGVSMAQDQAVGIVRSKVDIIPFRGMVRRVTGAEKHAKKVARAYEAGKLRRAFLKGLLSAYGCTYPPLVESIAP